MQHPEIRILTDDELAAIAGGARLDGDDLDPEDRVPTLIREAVAEVPPAPADGPRPAPEPR
jgi:hypothetical protein